MAKRNRDTLKNFFKKGAMPSEDQFSDLIDSGLNMVDEGFSKSPQNGLEITSQGNHENLVTFFQGSDPGQANWSLSYGDDAQSIQVVPRQQTLTEPPLTISYQEHPDHTYQGKVGINTSSPQFDLDVEGVIRCSGRVGSPTAASATVPANGQWHDISELLGGCHAFEVMAGAGKKKSGKYALLHAIAINTYNPHGLLFNFLRRKNRIRYTQSYYYSRADKLKLRWKKGSNEHSYTLQLRTNTNYGKGIVVQYYLTRLWFDPDMHQCWQNQE